MKNLEPAQNNAPLSSPSQLKDRERYFLPGHFRPILKN